MLHPIHQTKYKGFIQFSRAKTKVYLYHVALDLLAFVMKNRLALDRSISQEHDRKKNQIQIYHVPHIKILDLFEKI